MRPRRLSRALRRGAEAMAVVEEELDEDAAVVVMRRTARCSTYRGARGGWAGDVAGRLRRTFPTGTTESLFKILSTRARG